MHFPDTAPRSEPCSCLLHPPLKGAWKVVTSPHALAEGKGPRFSDYCSRAVLWDSPPPCSQDSRSLWSRGVLCELELAAILSAILSHLWKGTQHQLDPVIHRIKIRRLLYKDLNTEYIVFLLPCLASSFLLDPGAFPSLL